MPYFARRQQQIEQQQHQSSNTILIPLKLAYINTNLHASVSTDANSRFIEIYAPINQRNSLCDTTVSYLTSSSPHSSLSGSPAILGGVNSSGSGSGSGGGGGGMAQNGGTNGYASTTNQPGHFLIGKNFNYYNFKFGADLSTGMYWLNRINAIVEKLTMQAISETNQLFHMVNKTHSFSLKYLGWLDEQQLSYGNNNQMSQSMSFGQSNFNMLKVECKLYLNKKILVDVLKKKLIIQNRIFSKLLVNHEYTY